jgi:hypothetical protein
VEERAADVGEVVAAAVLIVCIWVAPARKQHHKDQAKGEHAAGDQDKEVLHVPYYLRCGTQ